MIRPRIVPHPSIHSLIWIPGAFSTELPYSPVFAMFRIEEVDDPVEGVSICSLWVCA